jgi:hypothetical protein
MRPPPSGIPRYTGCSNTITIEEVKEKALSTMKIGRASFIPLV